MYEEDITKEEANGLSYSKKYHRAVRRAKERILMAQTLASNA